MHKFLEGPNLAEVYRHILATIDRIPDDKLQESLALLFLDLHSYWGVPGSFEDKRSLRFKPLHLTETMYPGCTAHKIIVALNNQKTKKDNPVGQREHHSLSAYLYYCCAVNSSGSFTGGDSIKKAYSDFGISALLLSIKHGDTDMQFRLDMNNHPDYIKQNDNNPVCNARLMPGEYYLMHSLYVLRSECCYPWEKKQALKAEKHYWEEGKKYFPYVFEGV